MQGQDFRLDMADCDISEDEHAAHVMRALRPLMVAHARICNKRITEERHKRAAPSTKSAAGASSMDPTPIDLSHAFRC